MQQAVEDSASDQAAIIRRLEILPRPVLDCLVFVFFVACSVVMTWPLAVDLPHRLISWGDPVFQAWTMAWDVHAWRTDPLSIFNANIFYPYHNTLAYSDHLFGQAALVSPVLLLTGNAILADNISVLLALALSGFAMYLLVVDLTGSRLAGLVAGFAYAFLPARLSHLEHLHLLSAQWLPLALLAARRTLLQQSWRWAIVLGVTVLLQGLFGVYYLYFLLVLLGVVFVAYLIARPSRATLLAIGRAATTCGLAALLLLPTLLPYQQVHDELGIERTTEEVTLWRARIGDYLAVSQRNRLYGETLGERYSKHVERDLFPGAILIGLAVVGLFNRRLGWERATIAALTVVAFILSFGLVADWFGREVPLPYQLFYDLVPGFRAIRVPARLALLGYVGLAALAGLGVDVLLRWLRSRPLRLELRWLASLGLAGVLLAGLALEYTTYIPLSDPLPATLAEADRADYAWMAENPAPAIEFPMGEGVVGSAWPNFWSTLHWNPVVNGYSGLTPPAYYHFREAMTEFPSRDTVRLLQGIGIETVVYHADPTRPASDDDFLVRARRFPELTEVVGNPDYVFQLPPDPWIWQLVDLIPEGEDVELPLVDAEPALFGMLAAVLQREGHTVFGAGSMDYWQLPSAPDTVCYAVLPSESTPDDHGYQNAELIEQHDSLALYRKAGCRV